MFLKTILSFVVVLFAVSEITAETGDWYTEGNYEPSRRIRITVTNTLPISIEKCPVVIKRTDLPVQDIPIRHIWVVDPNLPPDPEPTPEMLRDFGSYARRAETNGHYIEHQLDDLNKDGIWDELFFMTDLEPLEARTFYLYIGFNVRGLFRHRVHANIADYSRHIVPFWESEYIGWKLYYPHDIDLHGKAEPMLTAFPEYSENLPGNYMPWKYGTDIMTVSRTFGAGGMCLFETSDPEELSRPRFSPEAGKGMFRDIQNSFDVVVNGPLRSIVKVNTMNWSSGKGFYEFEQYYIAYAHKSWCTSRVVFKRFLPEINNVRFGCGIRKIMDEYKSIVKDGMIISLGRDIKTRSALSIDLGLDEELITVEFQGIALAVKGSYNPEYHSVKAFGGNHVFSIPATGDLSYEYMLGAGWSYGTVNNNEKDFVQYMTEAALLYNNPPRVTIYEPEEKPQD